VARKTSNFAVRAVPQDKFGLLLNYIWY